jgi:hypothetical protein
MNYLERAIADGLLGKYARDGELQFTLSLKKIGDINES